MAGEFMHTFWRIYDDECVVNNYISCFIELYLGQIFFNDQHDTPPCLFFKIQLYMINLCRSIWGNKPPCLYPDKQIQPSPWFNWWSVSNLVNTYKPSLEKLKLYRIVQFCHPSLFAWYCQTYLVNLSSLLLSIYSKRSYIIRSKKSCFWPNLVLWIYFLSVQITCPVKRASHALIVGNHIQI